MNGSDLELADYTDILRRRWKLVVVGVLVGLLGALGALFALPKTYTSTASVMVVSTGEEGAVAGGRTNTPVNLDTEAQIVQSTVVSQLALDGMADPVETSTRALVKHVTVTVPPNTSVLNIAFSATTRDAARDGANAYANAYLENRKTVAERRVETQATTAETQIGVLERQINRIDRELSALPPDSPARVGPNVRREMLASQVSNLSSTLVGLQSSGITPGEVITEAQVPLGPSSPNTTILLASGVLAGLLLGLLAGYVVDRLDRRVRDRRTLDSLGVDALASGLELTPSLGSLSEVSTEGMRQVRNGLMVRLPAQHPSVLVASTSDGVAGSLVALHLAEKIARSGLKTLLLSANSARCLVSETFEVAHRRGLSELLRGRAGVSEALYDVPGQPNLFAIHAGSLHSELLTGEVDRVLRILTSVAEVVVIDVAPTSKNADAQSLASKSSGVLIVAEAMVTRRDQVSNAVDQFRHVSAEVFGGLVVRVERESRLKLASQGAAGTRAVDDDEAAGPGTTAGDAVDGPENTEKSTKRSEVARAGRHPARDRAAQRK